MDISVVVPVYGCRAALHELHRRLVESVSTITDDFEIILVNDACPQNSWEVIEEICKEDSRSKMGLNYPGILDRLWQLLQDWMPQRETG